MHQHLRDIPAMRLILRHIQNHLRRADNRSRFVFSHDYDPLPARQTRGHAPPERLRLRSRHRKHETDRRAALHAIDQHITQPLYFALTHGLQTSNLNTTGQFHFIS
jgi:hypothetical protein